MVVNPPSESAGAPLELLPGLLAPDYRGLAPGTLTPVANRLYVARFVPRRDMTIVALRHVLSTVASIDDQIDVGILDVNGNRIVSTGAIAGKLVGATGTKQTVIAPTQLLQNTAYFAAFAHGAVGGTAAILCGLSTTSFGLSGIFNVAVGAVDNRSLYATKDASFPIPASVPLTTCTLTGGAVPAMALME